jgi:LmbE family N-acetylglucosaminyl deacetylase
MTISEYFRAVSNLYSTASGGAALSIPALEPGISALGRILIFAPHPDDECLMSGLALRLRREKGARVAVFPFSFGSDPKRRQARKKELGDALRVLGFELLDPRSQGEDREAGVDWMKKALEAFQPDAVVLPHSEDGHPAHKRCSIAGLGAIQEFVRDSGKAIRVFESEYWSSIAEPNLLLPLSTEDAIVLGEALLCHEGEVARHPYQWSLPAALMDQMRRGLERVSGGMGGNVPSRIPFGQLYRTYLIEP